MEEARGTASQTETRMRKKLKKNYTTKLSQRSNLPVKNRKLNPRVKGENGGGSAGNVGGKKEIRHKKETNESLFKGGREKKEEVSKYENLSN